MPLPSLSCASISHASQSPFLSKAKSETFPILISSAVGQFVQDQIRALMGPSAAIGAVLTPPRRLCRRGVDLPVSRAWADIDVSRLRSTVRPRMQNRRVLSNSLLFPVASSTSVNLLCTGFCCLRRDLASLAEGYFKNAAHFESSEIARSRGAAPEPLGLRRRLLQRAAARRSETQLLAILQIAYHHFGIALARRQLVGQPLAIA